MKRQTRPFLVEVKKKRGDAARKQSIWGGLDLSAIAAEAPERMPEVELQRLDAKVIEQPSISEDVTITPSTMPMLDAQIVADVDTADLEHTPSGAASIEPARPKLSRRRHRSAETFPRGQRWKRRLPKVLRGKK